MQKSNSSASKHILFTRAHSEVYLFYNVLKYILAAACCIILTTMLLLLSWSRKYLYLCSCILLLYVVILFVNTKYLTYPTSCKRKIMLEVVCVTTFFLTSDFLWSIFMLWTHSRTHLCRRKFRCDIRMPKKASNKL